MKITCSPIESNERGTDKTSAIQKTIIFGNMGAEYIKIFTDEMIVLETSDGSPLLGIIQSSKNNLDRLEAYSTEIQELYEIVITVGQKGNDRCDFPIKIKDIRSIERLD
ncbi:hypothetical protein [Flagellimonas marina]|uniref:Uncharacterized protein n=1 Tax=Flagellimonas marina TaxID=1775168 RepID=A0ABV8PHJ6_9FLAO